MSISYEKGKWRKQRKHFCISPPHQLISLVGLVKNVFLFCRDKVKEMGTSQRNGSSREEVLGLRMARSGNDPPCSFLTWELGILTLQGRPGSREYGHSFTTLPAFSVLHTVNIHSGTTWKRKNQVSLLMKTGMKMQAGCHAKLIKKQ